MTDADVVVLPDDADLEPAFEVRRDVFVDEQDVDEAIEIDGKDPQAEHVLARIDGDPVGTARLRQIDEATGKVERVAVCSEYRRTGLGREIMAAVESLAAERGVERLELHAQTAVEEFYEKLGYETTSDVFEEAGIPHVAMEKELTDSQ